MLVLEVVSISQVALDTTYNPYRASMSSLIVRFYCTVLCVCQRRSCISSRATTGNNWSIRSGANLQLRLWHVATRASRALTTLGATGRVRDAAARMQTRMQTPFQPPPLPHSHPHRLRTSRSCSLKPSRPTPRPSQQQQRQAEVEAEAAAERSASRTVPASRARASRAPAHRPLRRPHRPRTTSTARFRRDVRRS